MSALRDDLHGLDELRGTAAAVRRPQRRERGAELTRTEDWSGAVAVGGTDAGDADPQPLALAINTLPVDATGANWTQTLAMVEHAAATIRAYEKRLAQLERQSRTLADRAAEDQHRLLLQVQALETRLGQAESRATAAETAVRDAEYAEWEASMRATRADERAVDAETNARQLEAYLRRVHEVLSAV